MKILLIATAAAFFATTPAMAQTLQLPCSDRDELLRKLAERYGEATAERGITASGALLEVLRNKDTETWTIMITVGESKSCLLASGTGWIAGEPRAIGPTY